ncbi:TetR/AcrR family transcriptional regulator [Nonomuraea glycinis]|uniref:TetR family transcriptional regulator n=1 Tax=Nonomuraea glycinis TaxID=2047744 RepID=A0A918E599_9ACTN|nr:TetR/AcrR family transcriptional regulator [Nonomuraea glycinis]MCA2178155.1 TetR/AcrR family transcriptional regulator [Nonomuraea glycinis]GGP05968.1 TetR family transcriptional regulator [Nonomuraea glycinis]
MVRLTRAQQQERTRAAVLAAAEQEFAERGYNDAKIDRIAERAELTRGAVYSNFPSKRALYLAVLVDSIEPAGIAGTPYSPGLAEALGLFARARLDRLPLTGDTAAGGKLRLRSLAGVFDDEPGRTALAQVTRLEALLLALALESRAPRTGRRVRLAELVLTLLNGAGHLADAAPGFVDPFDVARACEHLAGLDLADTWDPPHLPFVPLADDVEEPWQPPASSPDEITGRQVGFDADGVIAVLGAGRLEAAEEAVRAARPGDRVTVAVVTSDPAEIGRLIRLRIGDLVGCLRGVLAPDAWQGPHLVLGSAVASAAGILDTGDSTEAAVRVQAGKIVARARGRGAAYAVATAEHR